MPTYLNVLLVCSAFRTVQLLLLQLLCDSRGGSELKQDMRTHAVVPQNGHTVSAVLFLKRPSGSSPSVATNTRWSPRCFLCEKRQDLIARLRCLALAGG